MDSCPAEASKCRANFKDQIKLDLTVHDDEEGCSPVSPMEIPLSPQDDPCSSSDACASSMGEAKKDKSCLVCGDKALGFNFNAVSCESCKAFFRRNAHKTIRGRCAGMCDVTIESRAFCKRCRLAKCFTVGMQKEMILNDDQKKQRKQKIIINKLRRNGQLPAQDKYSASHKDLLMSSRLHSVSLATDSDTQQQPQLADGVGSVGRGAGGDRGGGDGDSSRDPSLMPPGGCVMRKEKVTSSPHEDHDHHNFLEHGGVHTSANADDADCSTESALAGKDGVSTQTVAFSVPWMNTQMEMEDIVFAMDPDDRSLLEELHHAMESTSFLSMSSSSLKMMPTTPEEFVNIAENFVRRVIKVAKNISSFKSLTKEDQIALLKGSVVDIMMLRSAVNYDPFTETWSLNTKGCISGGTHQASGDRISAQVLLSSSRETWQLFITYSKFIKSLMSTIHGDLLVLKLLIMISLFSADRFPMQENTKVQNIQEKYGHVLEKYICLRFKDESNLFAKLIMKLTDLRNVNEVHSKMLLKMKMENFEPLLLEIFDLPWDGDAKPNPDGSAHSDGYAGRGVAPCISAQKSPNFSSSHSPNVYLPSKPSSALSSSSTLSSPLLLSPSSSSSSSSSLLSSRSAASSSTCSLSPSSSSLAPGSLS